LLRSIPELWCSYSRNPFVSGLIDHSPEGVHTTHFRTCQILLQATGQTTRTWQYYLEVADNLVVTRHLRPLCG
jgi:hypothetical protein